MSTIEQQPDQPEEAQAFPFAPAYESRFSSLPPSQLREAFKRLAERRRNPLPAESLTEENPEVEAVLTAVERAYLAKKARAKAASAAKRAAAKARPDNVAVEDVGQSPTTAQALCGGSPTDLTASVAEMSLEPAAVVAAEEEPESEEEPEPEPEPVKPLPSKPIPIPERVPLARQRSEAPPSTLRNQPKNVGGLRGRFA